MTHPQPLFADVHVPLLPLLSTLYAPSWLAAWGVHTPEDSLDVPKPMLLALPALSRSCAAAVKAELCSLRARAHQERLGHHQQLELSSDLRFEHDVGRVFSPATRTKLRRAGVRTMGDLTRASLPRHLLDPAQTVRCRTELLTGLVAIELWASRQFAAMSQAFRLADGLESVVSVDGDEDGARACFAAHLVERGLLNVCAADDGSSIGFRPTHPHHSVGRSLLAWVLGHAEGVASA